MGGGECRIVSERVGGALATYVSFVKMHHVHFDAGIAIRKGTI